MHCRLALLHRQRATPLISVLYMIDDTYDLIHHSVINV